MGMRYHKSRAGTCVPYAQGGYVRTIPLDTDSIYADPESLNILTTKVVLSRYMFPTTRLKAAAKAHFKVARGHKGNSVAECRFREEVVCRHRKESTKCMVRKQIKCLRVCKLKEFRPLKSGAC